MATVRGNRRAPLALAPRWAAVSFLTGTLRARHSTERRAIRGGCRVWNLIHDRGPEFVSAPRWRGSKLGAVLWVPDERTIAGSGSPPPIRSPTRLTLYRPGPPQAGMQD